MRISAVSVTALLSICVSVSTASELEKIDRRLQKQPDYRSKEPRYCLLVFGPRADTHVWLVLDLVYDPLREKPGDKDALYADLNGDGDLTDPKERIPVTVVTQQYTDPFTFREHERHLPRFNVGELKGRDGKTRYAKLVVDVGWYVPGRGDREVTVSVDVPGRGRQSVGGRQLWFAKAPKEAPVIWFDGKLTMRVAPSGILHCPIDYSGKEPPPPWYEEVPLVRGERGDLRIQIGTPGLGPGTFNTITANIPPEDVHPVAEIEFPHRDPARPAIKVTAELKTRCCGTLFSSPLDVPGEVAVGKAKVRLSFPGWRAVKVEVATLELSVVESGKRPPAPGAKK